MPPPSLPPFRSLRDLVLKDLQGKRPLLTWNNDPSFTHEVLDGILESEAYLLDTHARDYLAEFADDLSIEDYLEAIARIAMPFRSVWMEVLLTDAPNPDCLCGALIRQTEEGISVFAITVIPEMKPWCLLYSGTEVTFCRDGQVVCAKTPISRLNDRIEAERGVSAERVTLHDVHRAIRIAGVFAVMCAVLERPRILERDPPRSLGRAGTRLHARASRIPPRYAMSVIRLSRAGRIERDAARQPSGERSGAHRAAHWVRAHLFLARNGKLTWRKAHVRGAGAADNRVHRVTE